MTTTIKFKRGSDATAGSTTPVDGEPLWYQDSKQLAVGDGSTTGGILLATDSDLSSHANGTGADHTYINQDVSSSGTPSFSQVSCSTAPTSGNHLTNKTYVDGLVQGLDWQESVKDRYDPVTETPPGPSTGDRYISTTTNNGWTTNYIYEYNGSTWDETIPNEGHATWVEDEDILYTYNGSAWVQLGSGVAADKISEGDSYFEVIDTGSDGHYIGELDGSVALYIDDTKVAIGDDVVYSGTNAIAIGENASAAGNYSIAIGETSSTTSTYALAIGGHATSPIQTISIGYSAGPAANGSNSVCVGHMAGSNSTDPDRDVFIGYHAGVSSVANDCVFVGSSCGETTDADDLVCIGANSGYNADNSDKSVFIGRWSGYDAADANNSVFMGYYAGYNADSSSGSVYIGYNSGASTNTTYTVCVGDQSGNAASGSGSSTFVGASAGSNATNANNSVFMGYYAGYNADNSNASVFIGYRAGQAFSSHANTLIIENSDDVINPLVYGEFGTSSTNKLCINTATAATSGAGLTVNGALILQNGTSIDEFSTDGTLAGDSDDAVPTEKAVRTYVDTQVFGSSGILQKIVNIGDWNMDTSIGVSVTFPGDVTFSKVIGIRGMIRNDDSTYLSAVPSGGSDCDMDVTFSDITSSTIILYRRAGGQFDNTSYDSTSFNRGWIIIDYTL